MKRVLNPLRFDVYEKVYNNTYMINNDIRKKVNKITTNIYSKVFNIFYCMDYNQRTFEE